MPMITQKLDRNHLELTEWKEWSLEANFATWPSRSDASCWLAGAAGAREAIARATMRCSAPLAMTVAGHAAGDDLQVSRSVHAHAWLTSCSVAMKPSIERSEMGPPNVSPLSAVGASTKQRSSSASWRSKMGRLTAHAWGRARCVTSDHVRFPCAHGR
jgi:hypothetical protein